MMFQKKILSKLRSFLFSNYILCVMVIILLIFGRGYGVLGSSTRNNVFIGKRSNPFSIVRSIHHIATPSVVPQSQDIALIRAK